MSWLPGWVSCGFNDYFLLEWTQLHFPLSLSCSFSSFCYLIAAFAEMKLNLFACMHGKIQRKLNCFIAFLKFRYSIPLAGHVVIHGRDFWKISTIKADDTLISNMLLLVVSIIYLLLWLNDQKYWHNAIQRLTIRLIQH